jgi:serine/threonine-protein kinase
MMSLAKLQSEKDLQNGLYYEVDTSKVLGKGGMGQIFQGTLVNVKNGTRRTVAVKFLFSDLADHAIERARREAQIQIDNENLLRMYSFIEIEDTSDSQHLKKRYHVVSEFINGVSLTDLIHGRTTNQFGAKLDEVEKLYAMYKEDRQSFSIQIITEILHGTQALHEEGYIHRDLDPSNIMINSEGHVKIVDFGIAKRIKELKDQTGVQDHQLTSQGQFVGKPAYAAPELVLGNTMYQDQTTDIYAIGVILFQLTTGRLPFEGNAATIIKQQVHSEVPLKLVPYPALRSVIKKATSKKQNKRYQSATEMLEDIQKKTERKWLSVLYINWQRWLFVALGLLFSFFLGSQVLIHLFK